MGFINFEPPHLQSSIKQGVNFNYTKFTQYKAIARNSQIDCRFDRFLCVADPTDCCRSHVTVCGI